MIKESAAFVVFQWLVVNYLVFKPNEINTFTHRCKSHPQADFERCKASGNLSPQEHRMR